MRRLPVWCETCHGWVQRVLGFTDRPWEGWLPLGAGEEAIVVRCPEHEGLEVVVPPAAQPLVDADWALRVAMGHFPDAISWRAAVPGVEVAVSRMGGGV